MQSNQQFNQITGRLQKSSHFQPLYPITPVPLQRVDSPKMIWDTIKTVPIKTNVSKPASYSTIPPELEAKMKHFQADMSKPVYRMGGTPDKILFGISIALTGVLGIMALQFIGRHINKK